MTITKNTVPKEIEAKIRTAIELKKELAKYEQEIKDALLNAMEQHNIKKIDNDAYYVTLVPRTTYKAESLSDVDEIMRKTVLDTKKAGEYDKLYGQLPTGVTKTTTNYIKWDLK